MARQSVTKAGSEFELCEKKLAPLGITVRKTEEDKPLPFADNSLHSFKSSRFLMT